MQIPRVACYLFGLNKGAMQICTSKWKSQKQSNYFRIQRLAAIMHFTALNLTTQFTMSGNSNWNNLMQEVVAMNKKRKHFPVKTNDCFYLYCDPIMVLRIFSIHFLLAMLLLSVALQTQNRWLATAMTSSTLCKWKNGEKKKRRESHRGKNKVAQ